MNFSVLLSLYIKEKPEFLRECLESLKNQTLPATEIVMVYDGSITTELEEVVTQFITFLPIKIIRLPQNVGLGKALNEGLKHCSYNWVFRMDTDDICLPERFAKQVNFISQYPDVVLFSGHIAEFTEDKTIVISYRKVPIGNEKIKKYALSRSPFNHMAVAFLKDIIEEVGGYQHHLFLEDYNLWLRVIAKGYEVGNMNEILLLARTGDGMVSRRRGKQYIKGEWELFKLKRNLKLQNVFLGFFTFLLRVIPRMLPTKILKRIYTFLRTNTENSSSKLLSIKEFSQERILEKENLSKKKTLFVNYFLFLPILIILVILLYYFLVQNNYIVYFLGLIGILLYYSIIRICLNYKTQKYLKKTVKNYSFSWIELWNINWDNELLFFLWQEKVLEKVNQKSISRDNILSSMYYYRNKQKKKFSFFKEIAFLSSSIIMTILNFKKDTNEKEIITWAIYILLISLTFFMLKVFYLYFLSLREMDNDKYKKMEDLCEYLLEKIK
jgi:glycosyltransferase, family 2